MTLITKDELECRYMSVAFSLNGRVVAAVSGRDCREDVSLSDDGSPCSVQLWMSGSIRRSKRRKTMRRTRRSGRGRRRRRRRRRKRMRNGRAP